jgi:hypothetical protein
MHYYLIETMGASEQSIVDFYYGSKPTNNAQIQDSCDSSASTSLVPKDTSK